MSNKDVAIALKKHLNGMGMTGAKGFHYMDRDDNKRLGAAEIVGEMKNAGIDIPMSQAQEITRIYGRSGGNKFDVCGYLRFMATADES